jgi:hypothetical protein
MQTFNNFRQHESGEVVLNSSMNWNEVSIHTAPDSYPEPATPESGEETIVVVMATDPKPCHCVAF